DGHGRVVDRMPGVETRPGVVPRRIVLEVDAGQAPLGPSQDLVLVRVPVLVGLVEDAVESHGGDVFGSDLIDAGDRVVGNRRRDVATGDSRHVAGVDLRVRVAAYTPGPE